MCDVLVLDDDPLVRMVAVDALEDAGFSVEEASCLREARAVLASRPSCCKVLLVDHDLGETDQANGFDFARERLASSPEVGAVLITGRWDLLQARPRTPRERHLRKPYALSELVRSVRELIEAA